MARALGLPFVAAILHAAQPAAAACLPPDEIVERMDEYFSNPRGVATYRALAGMGDPRIAAFSYDYSGQESLFRAPLEWDERKALTARMLPEQRPDPTYWQPDEGRCRLDHPLWLARARVATLGAEHPYVRQWFAVQKAVFEACINRTSEGASPLPGPIRLSDPALAALQAEDRAYQQASRLFYEESPRAPEAFRRIAASASRHAPIARYMTLVLKIERPAPSPVAAPAPQARQDDQGSPPMDMVGEPRSAEPAPDVPAIVAEADLILADSRLAPIHPLVQGLIGKLAWNSARDYGRREGDPPNPAAPLLFQAQVRLTLAALKIPAERLRTDPVARELYARAAEDVGGLHRRFPDPAWWLTGLIPGDAYGSRAMAAAAKTDRFAAWLLYPPSPFRTMAWGRAGRALNWDSRLHWVTNSGHSADSLAWRVAGEAASRDEGGWGMIDEMAGEARACAEDATLAALPELFYHQVRKSLTYRNAPAAVEKSFAAALDHLAAWPWRDSEHHRETIAAALRYLIEVGRTGDARRLRDRLLASTQSDNRYDAALLLLAEDEAHLVAALAEEGGRDRERLLNILSSSALQRLAARPDLAAADRARFARVAWSRRYALGRPVSARLDRLMRRLNPEVTRQWRSRPGGGARIRDRKLLLDVLSSPAMNILITAHQRPYQGAYGKEPGLTELDTFQHSDNNWWCAWQKERHEGAVDHLLYRQFFSGPAEEDEDEFDPLAVAGARRVLSPLLETSWLWARRDLAEERALAQIPSAPRLLAERAIAWSGRPAAGQDEALALSVRATRYGCQRQGGHGVYSQQAFALLHQLYPESEAAKRTRYWFD